MAYSSHVARRDVSARSGVTPRTMFAGCAAAALTVGAIYGVSQYIDMGGALDRAPVAARVAEAPGAPTPSLFDPRLSLGVGGGFVPAPWQKAPAPVATNRPEPAHLAAKPVPLPETVEETDVPTPLARPVEPEVAAIEPELFVPAPPRRPEDLAPAAPRLAARPVETQVSRVAPPALPAPTAAPLARADHLERLTGGDRVAARAEPAPTRARARILSRRASVLARARSEEPSFFQKLFGGLQQQPTGALAYAPANRFANDAISAGPASRRRFASLGSESISPRVTPDVVTPRLGGGRAVYDISAQVVVLPDGTRLEAHSGLGPNRDNVRSAHLRMRGVTPPHVYNLREREALFHGVRAIRLTPVGGAGAIHNRNGLLAHTYMLGPNGDSNGCVSIRDYNAFLSAYLQGKITQLVVVESMRDLSSQFALR